ncbi:hypothetical protein CGLO_12147 [Colletotrichum gloeosporioides Cg-14]|uniref:Nephrocystin 3-like N-terminal domain-containing protein n=1 Tax=Colletotrichum gloeosporioides (strain Cg-14) TaxID=1237896 RepID=T0LK81_COLGC|nr:hypothetical protein CGLO_12147 [Colletotrichum gloeosporioides Cg-14]
MSGPDTEDMMRTLYEIHGVMGSFKAHLDLHDDDDDRMESLHYLMPVINRSSEALQTVKDYVSSGRTEKAFRGIKFDKKLKASLKRLDDASKVFRMAILSNQHSIMMRVDKYVEAISIDMKDVQAAQMNAQQDNSYQDVRAWLGSQADNDVNCQLHERNLLARHTGSGSWLLENEEFQRWLSADEKGLQTKFWLRGAPGVGKSFLCSTAIEHVSKTLQGVCLYYFYRFDDQADAGCVVKEKAASLLVDQLFRHFWQRDQRIASHVSNFVKVTPKTGRSLAEVTRLILRQGHQFYQGEDSVSHPERLNVYLFLDGLDESKDLHAVDDVLRLLQPLEEEPSVIHKAWISSREANVLKFHLQQWPLMNLDQHGAADVKNYLTQAIPNVENNVANSQEVEGKPLDEWILQKLQDKAKSNFLYARLMVEWLKDDVFTVDDVIAFVKSKVPNNIAEMYRRIFRHYQESQHKFISLLFSLVAFARRPLRLYELQEAMTMALSDYGNNLDPRKAPRNLQVLFAPLVEIQNDPKDPENPVCRLCHSTVQEFLIANPDVLRGRASNDVAFKHMIAPSQVGDVCLRYLSQSRYSALVDLPPGTCDAPPTILYDDVQKHGLLPYSAKYWDRHLEDSDPTPELRENLLKFLKSSNIQSLLQIQSLFVSAHFTQFKLLGEIDKAPLRPMYRRSFPDWLGLKFDIKDSEFQRISKKIRHDYRHYVNEWGYLLEHGTCASFRSGKCLTEHFWGEVDRCLTGLLGPGNFMNQMKEKYPSFMLTLEPFETHKSREFVIADTLSPCASHFITMTLPSEDSREVHIDNWNLKIPNFPQRMSRTTLDEAHLDFKSDSGRCIAFSHAIAKFVSNNRGCDYNFIFDQQEKPNLEPLFTDFDMRDEIVVVASRNVRRHHRANNLTNEDSVIQKITKLATALDSDQSDTGDEASSDGGYSSSSSDENSAFETCSEGSTEAGFDESEDETPSEMGSDAYSDKSYEEETDEEDSDHERAEQNVESNVDKPPSRRLVANYKQPAGSSSELEANLLKEKEKDRPTYPGIPSRFRDPNDRITASAAVYSISSGKVNRLFHYDHNLPPTSMLYHSPPALHPQKPLMVWPLGGGEVLFADFEAKTYFIRAIMPSTREIRFSPCGSFVHIASVEGRLLDKTLSASTPSGGNGAKKSEIVLSLFLTTHRLSSRKSTHSPPRLIHKVKLTLGQFTGFSLTKLPFTFVWTSDNLYFTVTGTRLNVFRVALFRLPNSMSHSIVTTPKLPVMLPLSASGRQVFYLPPDIVEGTESIRGRGLVLIGSYAALYHRAQLHHRSVRAELQGMGSVANKELLDYASPAVGFYVDEGKDLGGWAELDADEKGGDELGVTASADGGERFRDGKLTRKVETFNWQDDIDMEGICDWCNGPMYYRRSP